jgi:hypothetical protein
MRLEADARGSIQLLTTTNWESNPLPSYDARTDTFVLAPKISEGPPNLPPGTIAVRIGLPGAVLNRVSDDMMPPDFAAYDIGTSTIRGVRGVKSGGAAHAIRRQDDGIYLFHERVGTTTLPTTGSGAFSGSYAGLLGSEAGGEDRGTITGLVTLEVDFAGGTVNGLVDKRIDQAGRAFDPVVLLPTRMEEGRFNASTAGGGAPVLGHATSPGAYSGAVVGATGGEIVGTMSVSHLASDRFENLVEAGAFVAERR